MIFAHPDILWFLLLVPLLGAWRWWRSRNEAGLRFSDVGPARTASPSWRVRLRVVPDLLKLAALAIGIVALARPQERDVVRTRNAEGIDIMLVLDTSTSMRAEDFRPNRFEAARDVASEFIDGRVSDRVGLVVFAAKAYTQAPLTLDYDFLQEMLDEVRVGVIQDGTAIGTALAMAVNRLKRTEAESKVVILLTDGQNNRGEIDPITASEVAQAMDVRVYAIGVGSKGTAPFIIDQPFVGQQRQMLPVEIDEDMLRTVAQNTGGRYFRATSKRALRDIYDEIGELEKSEIDERIYTDVEERYPTFLIPAFGLLLLGTLLQSTALRRFP
ncbi:aerotolerance regulator BatA [Longibacter salinarum]|uniref:Aerotolerance regulator BatA n=1 Tax=Longibacter salinarum TaxID=1850348 RepID=A0A2A8CX15_9BACT|nr:VWA domain-containing protein [Longibacter salinarum]PEN13245.1 aerotolerance regulator BatA [Longibacter salinarum]